MSDKQEQDPEYGNISSESPEKNQQVANVAKQNDVISELRSIILNEFDDEISNKETEIYKINEVLSEARSSLDRLRACVVAKYYSWPDDVKPLQLKSMPGIHPTVKSYLGKCPKLESLLPENLFEDAEEISDVLSEQDCIYTLSKPSPQKSSFKTPETSDFSTLNSLDNSEEITEVRNEDDDLPRGRIRYSIIVGNVSKYIPSKERRQNEQLTHLWKVYVREAAGFDEVTTHVYKVRFILHPSFRPNNIVDVNYAPFEITKRGWGDFPLRVQVFFKGYFNKPVDIIHPMKLDKTFSARLTLGQETQADILLYGTTKVPQRSKGCDTSSVVPIITDTTYEEKPEDVPACHSNVSENNAKPPNKKARLDNKDCELVEVKINKSPLKTVNPNLALQVNGKDLNETVLPNTCQAMGIPNWTDLKGNSPILSNPILASTVTSKLPNGTTVFVKCVDSKGRKLLVPQTSLLCLKPNKNNKCSLAEIESTSDQAMSVFHQRNEDSLMNGSIQSGSHQMVKMTTPNVPLYVLKVVPSQKIGPSQVLLINASNEHEAIKDKLLPIAAKSTTLEQLNNNKLMRQIVTRPRRTLGVDNFPLKSKKMKTTPVVQRKVWDINIADCDTFEKFLSKVVKQLPIVDADLDRRIFPFCAQSLETFLSWNIGKRKASEWQRASRVRSWALNILQDKHDHHLKVEDIWSKKRIMVWYRRRGYTPYPTSQAISMLCKIKGKNVIKCSLTDAKDLLSTIQMKPSSDEIEAELDVEAIDEIKISETDIKQEMEPKEASLSYCLPFSSIMCLYVKDTARQTDVKLQPIELEPFIYASVIEEMLLSACKQFAEDILRSAVDKSCTRIKRNFYASEITMNDVYVSILENDNFEFLSNRHMGIPPPQAEENS